MNYLWEIMIRACEQGIPEPQIRFKVGDKFGAYMELSNEYLNQEALEEWAVVEVNPYYRFYDIFKDLFHPDMTCYPQLRESLSNVMFHQLAQKDQCSGMSKESYYKKLLVRDLGQGIFGERAKEIALIFPGDERELVLSGVLRQYQTGSSLELFTDMMESLISDNVVYQSREEPEEILVYVGLKQETKLVEKVDYLIQMFLDLSYHAEVFYEYHFGILGVGETMVIDEIMMY